jgi:hypothetical protein
VATRNLCNFLSLAKFLHFPKPGSCGFQGWVAHFDLAQFSNRRGADKFFAAGYLATGGGRTFRGEDHSDDWRHLDVVVIKRDGARKVGGRALRSRPQEAVPRYYSRKQQAPGLHEGAHPRCLISMPSDAC